MQVAAVVQVPHWVVRAARVAVVLLERMLPLVRLVQQTRVVVAVVVETAVVLVLLVVLE